WPYLSLILNNERIKEILDTGDVIRHPSAREPSGQIVSSDHPSVLATTLNTSSGCLLKGLPFVGFSSPLPSSEYQVEVLEKSKKDLEQARKKDKVLFEEAIGKERKLSEENHETFKEEMIKDTNEKLSSRPKPVEPLEWKASENRLKPSSIEPPKLELKELPKHLEYAFLQENNQLPVVISSALSATEKARLLEVLRDHKGAIAWSIADIKGIDSSFCTQKILLEDEFKPSIQPQRRVNPNIKEVVKKEVINLLDAELIYPISDSPWVSPVQVVPKKRGMTVVKNDKDELIPQRTVIRWRVYIDYRKLNNETRKDHFPPVYRPNA
ncbi:hypothetical protein Tco_1216291, partial [Tanacetum coccineum]